MNASGLWPNGGEVLAEAAQVFVTTFSAVAGHGLLYGAAATFVAALADGWIFDRKNSALSRALSQRTRGGTPVVTYRAGGRLYLFAGMSAVSGFALVGLSGARLWVNGPMLIASVVLGAAGGALEAHRALKSQAYRELQSLLQEEELPSLTGYGRRTALAQRLTGQLAERAHLFEAASLQEHDDRTEKDVSSYFASVEALLALLKAQTKTPKRQRAALNKAMRTLRCSANAARKVTGAGQKPADAGQATPSPAGGSNPSVAWERAQARFDATLARYVAYELDVALQIDFPQIIDPRNELVSAYRKAYKLAWQHLTAKDSFPDDTAAAQAALEAAIAYEVAFDAAESWARASGRTAYTPTERAALEAADASLQQALHGRLSAAQVQAQLRRVIQKISIVLPMPAKTVQALGARCGLPAGSLAPALERN